MDRQSIGVMYLVSSLIYSIAYLYTKEVIYTLFATYCFVESVFYVTQYKGFFSYIKSCYYIKKYKL